MRALLVSFSVEFLAFRGGHIVMPLQSKVTFFPLSCKRVGLPFSGTYGKNPSIFFLNIEL